MSQTTTTERPVKEITVADFQHWKAQHEKFQLIDVREPFEFDLVNIGAELIPLGQIAEHADRISRDVRVIIHCKTGRRSATAIRELEDKFGFTNLYNLKGGIFAYIENVRPDLSKY